MVPLPSQQALRARTFLTFRPRFFAVYTFLSSGRECVSRHLSSLSIVVVIFGFVIESRDREFSSACPTGGHLLRNSSLEGGIECSFVSTRSRVCVSNRSPNRHGSTTISLALRVRISSLVLHLDDDGGDARGVSCLSLAIWKSLKPRLEFSSGEERRLLMKDVCSVRL